MSLPLSIHKRLPKRLPHSLGFKRHALYFDGDDYVHVPDSDLINTGGPYPNRTIEVLFKCYDVSRTTHQVIWEEGGTARGFNIYILNGRLYAGAWNEPETLWDGSWISTPVKSNTIYHVFLILRNGTDTIEPDKLELWVNGKLIGKEQGTQVYAHPADIGVGAIVQDTKFHDVGDVLVDLGYYLYGEVYLVRVYNVSLNRREIIHNMLNYHSPVRDGLVLWLHDRIIGDTWYDESGMGNHGAIYGAVRGDVSMWELRAEVGL